MPNPTFSERMLQDAILECAETLGWLCFHPRPARTKDGWRTAAQGNGAAGFPDLTLARNGWLVFAELKSERGRLSPAQQVWLDELTAVSFAEDRVLTHIWTPQQWVSGSVERVLRETGAKKAQAA